MWSNLDTAGGKEDSGRKDVVKECAGQERATMIAPYEKWQRNKVSKEGWNGSSFFFTPHAPVFFLP